MNVKKNKNKNKNKNKTKTKTKSKLVVFKLNGPYGSAYLAFSKSMFTVFLSFNEIQESNQIGLGLLKSASVMNIKPQTQKEEIILTPHDNLQCLNR